MSNASLDTYISSRFGKVLGAFVRLTARVWDYQKLSARTKT